MPLSSNGSLCPIYWPFALCLESWPLLLLVAVAEHMISWPPLCWLTCWAATPCSCLAILWPSSVVRKLCTLRVSLLILAHSYPSDGPAQPRVACSGNWCDALSKEGFHAHVLQRTRACSTPWVRSQGYGAGLLVAPALIIKLSQIVVLLFLLPAALNKDEAAQVPHQPRGAGVLGTCSPRCLTTVAVTDLSAPISQPYSHQTGTQTALFCYNISFQEKYHRLWNELKNPTELPSSNGTLPMCNWHIHFLSLSTLF